MTAMDRFIRDLEHANELIIVEEPVSPNLEITEITDRISKQPGGGKALLFKETGTDFPLLINAFGSDMRIKLAFGGRSPDDLNQSLTTLFREVTRPAHSLMNQLSRLPRLAQMRKWMPRRKRGRGICQQVVQENPDLSRLPVLTCWPADGGPFITLPLVHTVDPETGSPNLGMYRMQVFGKRETGMHWHLHKTGARHYRQYKKAGLRMPVAVALGGDPVYTYAATAPLPDGIDEYLLAGFIRNRPVRLVKCLTQDLWVPADADLIIEGYVDPSEDLALEGPFGDHTGFYSLADDYPRFHVTAVTHRRGAVYPATIVGIPPMEDAWMAKATEVLFREPLKMAMIPELRDFHLPVAGVAHNIGLFSIRNDYPGMGRKILNTVWGAGQMMFTKFGIVLDAVEDLRDYLSLLQYISQRVNPAQDLVFLTGPLDILDHASDTTGFGGKLGIDATGMPKEFPQPDPEELMMEVQSFRSHYPDVLDIRVDLPDMGISAGRVVFRKSPELSARQLATELQTHKQMSRIRCWILTDCHLPDLTWFETVWITGSHVDPSRDAWVWIPGDASGHPGILFLDATIKTRKADQFPRDWPNPVVMDQVTQEQVNKKWPHYALGPFIESPSVRYRLLMRGSEAVSQPD